MSGLACSALVRSAKALSGFHSVEMRATTSMMSLFWSTTSKKPSRRWIAFWSPRSPIRIAALYLPPALRALSTSACTVDFMMARLSACTAEDLASLSAGGRLKCTIGMPALLASRIAGMTAFESVCTMMMPETFFWIID